MLSLGRVIDKPKVRWNEMESNNVENVGFRSLTQRVGFDTSTSLTLSYVEVLSASLRSTHVPGYQVLDSSAHP
jgi:hypothetical protein